MFEVSQTRVFLSGSDMYPEPDLGTEPDPEPGLKTGFKIWNLIKRRMRFRIQSRIRFPNRIWDRIHNPDPELYDFSGLPSIWGIYIERQLFTLMSSGIT